MHTKWISETFKYDGTQLRSLFAYIEFKLRGDSIIAWRGPCNVDFDEMVDGEDLIAGATIAGHDMVHFIVELFDKKLFSAVCVQRLLASIALDVLRELSPHDHLTTELFRDGDDIFVGERKHSISIATLSPISALIHFAVNVSNEGTPVPTIALDDFAVEPEAFASEVMERFCFEIQTIKEATEKVRWVK